MSCHNSYCRCRHSCAAHIRQATCLERVPHTLHRGLEIEADPAACRSYPREACREDDTLFWQEERLSMKTTQHISVRFKKKRIMSHLVIVLGCTIEYDVAQPRAQAKQRARNGLATCLVQGRQLYDPFRALYSSSSSSAPVYTALFSCVQSSKKRQLTRGAFTGVVQQIVPV